MKKILLTFIFIICFTLPSFADEWDDFSSSGNFWDGQKSITNKEFEDTINQLEAKKNKKEEKNRKKKAKKISGGGTSLHSDLNPMGEILSQPSVDKELESNGSLLNVPVCMIIDGNVLDKGFYNVFGEKDDKNNIYLKFYQSQFFKGQVKAYETTNDYDKDSIDFVEMIPYNEHFVKIIFGSLDFNAYAYVRYISD